MSESIHGPGYPARLTIDYPEIDRNRGSVFLRLLFAIPVVVILSLLTDGEFDYERANGWFATEQDGLSYGLRDSDDDDGDGASHIGVGAGMLFLPTLLTLLFVRRYPRWWFDWHLAFTRFSNRVLAYVALLRDEYPALEDEQAVHVDLDYPDAAQLGRGMPLIKWLLAVPHWICLVVLGAVAILATIVAWFAILLTGQHPRGLFDFVVGVMRWGLRVQAYALLLTTDEYPPFSLN